MKEFERVMEGEVKEGFRFGMLFEKKLVQERLMGITLQATQTLPEQLKALAEIPGLHLSFGQVPVPTGLSLLTLVNNQIVANGNNLNKKGELTLPVSFFFFFW